MANPEIPSDPESLYDFEAGYVRPPTIETFINRLLVQIEQEGRENVPESASETSRPT